MDDFPAATLTPDPAAPHPASDPRRKHAACDECRKRKLKCSGKASGCTRYQERTDFQNICNSPMVQTVRRSAPSSSMSSVSQSSITNTNTPPSDNAHTSPDADWYNQQYRASFSSWPDFSHIPLPALVAGGFDPGNTTSNGTPSGSDGDPLCGFDPTAVNPLPPSVPECACLPNLYLTLSTLSALAAFPPSSHTVSTLANAHRTARDVIYCAICPDKFHTRSQNVMLSATLLTVLIDQWRRVSKSPAAEIRSGFCIGPTPPQTEMTARQDLEWRTFTHHLMRYFVFGDHPLPLLPHQLPEKAHSYLPPPSTQQHITLIFLADAMERRQRVWHEIELDTGEFPPTTPCQSFPIYNGLSLEDLKELDKCRLGSA
ncbi:hypothetical protein DV737_g5211, partial [Chaetothyriales sp. CBS 132003]